MKVLSATIYRIMAFICVLLVVGSCNKKETLTPSEDNRLYKLPQGDQPYDQQIMNFYNEYSSTILYKWDSVAFIYSPFGRNPVDAWAVNAEGSQVQECLDFLNAQWWSLYSKDFLKKTLPFKILLASDIKWIIPTGEIWPKNKEYHPFAMNGTNHVTFGKAGKIASLTQLEIDSARGQLHAAHLALAVKNGQLELPPAFIALTYDSYTNTVNAAALQNYGVFRVFNAMQRADDFLDYIRLICSKDYTTISTTLFTPQRDPKGLYKMKYDAIVNYYLATYNIDLQAIGNM